MQELEQRARGQVAEHAVEAVADLYERLLFDAVDVDPAQREQRRVREVDVDGDACALVLEERPVGQLVSERLLGAARA